MRTIAIQAVIAALILIATVVALPARAADCATLLNAKLPDTTITVAQAAPAGKFSPPRGQPVEKLPAFCRVAGVIRPSRDSDIRFEVWLPASGWNGRLLSAGNGGFAGSIDYNAMAGDLRRGYATASTDTGHEADWSDGSWAFHHPEKVADFGYRALHATTQNAKSLIQAFYTRLPEHSYFDSCSNGGREGLMEAQRFPEDFDGILAGAPANAWTDLMANGIDVAQALYGRNPAGYISSTKTPALQAAALAACDGQDAVEDGVISDPLQCHFDPSVLLCQGDDSPSCLTAPQMASAKRIYAGGVNAQGKQVYPGLMPGAEDGPNSWAAWITGTAPGQGAGAIIVENYFRYMVYEDAKWNPLTAKVELIQREANEKTARTLNATDPDLRRFQARGGKLILYHGWNDSAISPLYTVNYYESVIATMGAQTAESFLRLYMVPGMLHCSGGPGANSFGQTGNTTTKGPEYGIYDALEQWVEKDIAPGDITATKYIDNAVGKGVQMTRPLCPYPQIAKYKGTGDANDSANFVCAAAQDSPAVADGPNSKPSR
jgi:Tannase and feruloyl esterase